MCINEEKKNLFYLHSPEPYTIFVILLFVIRVPLDYFLKTVISLSVYGATNTNNFGSYVAAS